MVGIELKLQRVIFFLTFQGQMRVLTVWPLFTWGCKLNLVTRVDEMLGASEVLEKWPGGRTAAPELLLGPSFDW